jgi:hypothetical protein
MKMTSFIPLALGLIFAAHAQSAPRGSFQAGEYEAAKAEAIETGKPIAIVTTELKSSCPKCLNANEEVFKQMKSDYIFVINDDKAGKGKLPKNVEQTTYEIYKSKGNVIPIVAVLSPEDDKLLGGLSYKQIAGDGKKAFKTLETEIAGKLENQPAKETPATTGSRIREWTNMDGKTIRAEALSSDGVSVTLKLENGRVVDYALDKLSEKSREHVTEALGSD